MPVDLPTPAREYFAAVNARDIERAITLFAEEATVRDEGAEMIGHAAIRAWVERTTRQYAPIATPERSEGSGSGTAVTAMVAGTFEGSPVRLTYRFDVARNQIVRLEIE